jgi:hypothetical protein
VPLDKEEVLRTIKRRRTKTEVLAEAVSVINHGRVVKRSPISTHPFTA